MKDQHEFDEQVRRKLEEREFAFQESDWLAAQQLIKGSRGRKIAWLPFLIVGLGLMITGTWWYATSDTATVEQVVEVAAPQEPEALPKEQVHVGDEAAMSTAETTEQRDATASERAIAIPEKDIVQVAMVPIEKTTGSQTTAITKTNAETTQHTSTTSTGTPMASNIGKASEANITSSNSPNVKTPSTPVDASGTDNNVAIAAPDKVSDKAITTGAAVTLPVVAGSSAVPNTMDAASATPPSGNDRFDDASTDLSAAGDTATQGMPLSGMTGPAQATGSAAKDSTDRPTTDPTPPTAVQDSAAAAIDPLLTAALNGASPWEISAMVGAILTGSTYSGSNSADWASGLSDRWTVTAGAEVMYLGRNFGIGTGLHYKTYEDRLQVDERTLTNTVITDSSYFQATSLTLLYVVGGVVINGQEYYVTQSHDTVINVLVIATTSTTNTIRLIDARDVVLSASYFEIPLLLDAHVTQGAWAIGLRAGPTIGLLSGRKGLVPNSTFDGYESFGEQQFRSTVFGLTARAYFRYRFSPGWSVGIEPTWRQQLGNTMESGDLQRRSGGAGALFSLSYRLQ